jgi:hypothetical protein
VSCRYPIGRSVKSDAADLVAYRNRMLNEPSGHTGRPYGIRTINHRVRNEPRIPMYGDIARSLFARRGPTSAPDDRAPMKPAAGSAFSALAYIYG